MRNLTYIKSKLTRYTCLVLFTVFSTLTISAQVSPQERQALIDLYNATNGDNWSNNRVGDRPWEINDPNSPVSDWHGVGVTNDQVISVSLMGNNLVGSIPRSIKDLIHLTSLRLDTNKLTGNIPAELGQLTKLETLHLFRNELTGNIPIQLGQLLSLNTLSLNNNQLTGQIPTELGNLINLRFLALHVNELIGTIPSQFGQLSNLETLGLNNNNLTGNIPRELGNLEKLVYLVVNNNQLTGEIPTELSSLVNLKELHLENNKFTGTIPQGFDGLISLEKFYLVGNNLNGKIPDLTNLPNLSTFWIQNNQFVFSDFESEFNNYKLKLGNRFFYTPQAKIDVEETRTVAEGESIVLLGSIAIGPNDTVQWYKDGVPIPDVPGKLVLGNITEADAGVYYFTITNSIVTGLTLQRNNIILNVTPAVDTCGVSASEKQALIDLFNSTNGPNWANPWDLNTPVCDWAGVTVENGKVVKLYLFGGGVAGPLPNSIGDLVNLTSLTITRSYGLTGTIPSTIGNLTNLTSLDLGGNLLTGDVPASLGNLTSLTYLNLAINKLDGAIPTELGNLVGLTQLGLTRNALTGTIPASISNLVNLTSLNLSLNQLTGPIPPELGTMTNLTSLSLERNLITGSIPTEIGSMTNLTGLNLFQNQLTGAIPPELGNLQNLISLSLERNLLTGPIPGELGNLSNLESLYLGSNQLTDIAPELGNLTKLKTLVLYINQITSSIPKELGNLINLETFTVERNAITGTIPIELGNLTKLKSLTLTRNQLTGSIPEGIGQLPNLQSLGVAYNNISGKVPSGLANLTSSGILTGLGLERNNFVFNDFESEYTTYNTGLTTFNYLLQGKVDQTETLSVAENGSITLTSTALTSTNNSYQWFKDGVAIPGATSKDLVITNAATTDAGVYHFIATNSVVTDLTLERNPITLTVTPDLCGVSAAEKQALIDLYNSTDGANWRVNTNWLTDAPVCDWAGVGVENGKVVRLYFLDNALNGELPASIGDLVNLTSIVIARHGRLTGSIPNTIGNWTNIKAIDLNSNKLSGEIPTELGTLSGLESINLGRNSLTGVIPSSLGDLSNLTGMTLESNRLSGSIPVSLANLSKLTGLSLFENALTGEIPSELGNLVNLEGLNLARNGLSGSIPASLGSLTKLQRLFLNANQLTGSIPSELGNLSQLTYLNMFRNGLSGSIPDSLGQLANLTFLSIEENRVTGEIPSTFGNLSNLVTLYLSTNQLSGSIPSSLGDLPQLATLGLARNKLSGIIPNGFAISATNDVFNSFGFSTNNFVFSDFESDFIVLKNNLTGFSYLEQGRVDEVETLSVVPGGSITLTSTALTSPNNNYQWFKNGVAIAGATSKDLIISNATDADAGTYYFTATNSVITDLTLQRNTITLTVDCGVSASEKQALVDLYNSTNGPNWTRNTNWLTDAPVCDWQGVVVTNGKVTGLSLALNGVAGPLPNTFSDLIHLETVTFERNGLTGTIPPSIGTMTALKFFHVGSNQLTGEIPPSLGNLTNLYALSLYSNGLTGSIPSELGNLVNLEFLNLFSNRLTGTVPASLGSLPKLKTLMLYINSLEGPLPAELGNLSTLENLHFERNKITGPIPASFGNLTSLKELNLGNNSLSGTIPSELGNLSNLIGLRLFWNRLEGEIPLELSNIPNLEVISLSRNTLSGSLPSSIGTISSLKILDVRTNNLSGEILESIGQLPNLTYLGLAQNNFSGSIPSGLAVLASSDILNNLTFSTNNFVFSDFEAEFQIYKDNITTLVYSPQAKVDQAETLSVTENGTITLTSTALTSVNNSYQWFKDGVAITGATNKDLVIANATTTDAGVYHFTATNSVVTDLTLERNPITLTVTPDLCGVSAAERQALIDLFNSTDGLNWTNNTNWLTDAPVCDWFGVTVVDGKVTELALFNNNLSGTLTDSIGDIIHLEILFLNGNPNLGGTIPRTIGNLTLLQRFQITGDNFSGTIPTEIGQLTSLSILYLGNNNLSGEIPESIGNLTNLRELFLDQNNLEGSIPNSFGAQMINLNTVYLYNNNLSGALPVGLTQVPNLSVLRMQRNQISSIPPEIGNMKKLTQLFISDNLLAGTIPNEIGGLQSLQVIYLDNNNLEGKVPEAFGNITSLRILGLGNNNLEGKIPVQISQIPSLVSLSIWDNNFVFSDFEDEHNVYTTYDLYRYSPQAKVDQTETLSVTENGTITLTSTALTSVNNSYQWFKDGVAIPGATSKDFVIANASTTDAGVYHFTATNSVVTDLTLERNPITLTVTEPICQVSAAEKQALWDLYLATNGQNWTNTQANNKPWDLNIPVCDWLGVTVVSNRVTKLQIGGNNLIGTLPASIGDLIHLTAMTINGNPGLIGSIPNEIGNLVNLEGLLLYRNALSGSIPLTIGSLSELTFLGLFQNNLTGSIPKEIGNLSKLHTLYAERNQLSGSIPPELGSLNSLINLHLFTNQLTGDIPSELGQLSVLSNFNLSDNKLSGSIPVELANMTSLGSLNLSTNELSGTIPAELSGLSNLKVLALSNNNFTGSIPQELSTLLNLESLYLANNEFEGSIPPEFINFVNFKILEIQDNKFIFSNFEAEFNAYQAKLGTKFKYAPQAKVDQTETLSVIENGTITLTSTALTSTNNSYQWFKDGVAIPSATSKDLVIADVAATDAGVYHFITTNSVVTGLTLERNPITLTITPDTCGVSASERQALWDLYVSTNGQNWTNTQANNQPWDLSISVCDWYGVTVVNGEVIGLNLENNALLGTILASISNVLHLTSLDLGENNITGQIPSSMGALLELTSLSLDNNNLSGLIPPALGSLSNLTLMDLSNNNLQGPIPIAFCNLSNATILDLSNNQLSGSIPKELGILTKLVRLDLRNNSFSGTIPSQLTALSNLEFLGLSNNQLSGFIPFTVSEFSRLEEFVLENNNFIFSNFESRHPGYVQNLNVAYQYSPQAKTDVVETKTVTTNGSITLTTVLSSENNSYQWFKDGTAITGATSRTYVIQNATLADAGVYHFTATNSVIAGLTLERHPITLTVEETCNVAATERQALIDLYNATGGANWTNNQANNQPWLINDPASKVCDWFGVFVQDGRVTQLNLRQNSLNGTLPDIFTSLPSLLRVNFDGNQLSGMAPASLNIPQDMDVLLINNNEYIFSDLEAEFANYQSKFTGVFSYEPQAKVDTEATQAIAFGGTITLTSTQLTSVNNQYQWYKNGLPIVGATNKDLVITNATQDDAGMYFFEATNTVVTGLTLVRNPISVEVRAEGDTCGVSDAEKQVLIDLYNSTDGPNWKNNTNWLTDTPVCDWYGINVIGEKLVAIDLFSNNLKGFIPNSIKNLIDLSTLGLHANSLEGDIPASIGELKNLRYLYLHFNNLSGNIPSSLQGLSNILKLNLSNNTLTGGIPKEIGSLPYLNELALNDNQLDGEIPLEIGSLENLQYLYVYNNLLTGTIPSEIGQLERLIRFNVFNNQLTGQIPVDLKNLLSLKQLGLSKNKLSGNIPSELSEISSLELIAVDDNLLSGDIPLEFLGMPNLLQLRFFNNEFVFSNIEVEFNNYQTKLGNNFKYSPQSNVDETETKTIISGQSITLTSTALTSPNNNYQWYKNGVAITGATNKDYIIENASSTDAGEYIFRATNSIVTGLTLERNPITLEVLPAGACKVSDADRQVLIDFYQTTNGDNWANTTNVNQPWLINNPESKVCNWYGVTVSADYKIESIRLPNNNLRGEIPASLEVLDDLKILDLAQNNMIGEIPVSLGNMPNLQTLNLRENVLVGAIPEAIGNLTSLQTLDLGLNRFSSVIPTTIGGLQNLKYLDLSVNKLEGTIPDGLYTIAPLQTIKLQENNLRGGVSDAIGNLSQLEVFWLSQNNFSGSIPASIATIPGLYSVHLDFNSFGGDLPLLIPNFAVANTDVQINNNRFVFSDFEPEHPGYRDNLTNYTYIPQARVDRTETIIVELGGTARLFTDDLTSTNNTYRWFKDGEFLIETTLREIPINNITEADLGTYYFTATNSTIEGLTLERNRIILKLEDIINPPGGGCDVLEGIADGSFESCSGIARTGNDEVQYNFDCDTWTSFNIVRPDAWLTPVNPSSDIISDNLIPSPDGGVFIGVPANNIPTRSGNFGVELPNLEIGSTYKVTFYQAVGRKYLDTEVINNTYGLWKVRLNSTESYKKSTAIRTEENVNWTQESIEFVATDVSGRLEFLADLEYLGTEYAPVYLLIDGIKVIKVDGDCGGGTPVVQSFCVSADNYPTIDDLSSPFTGNSIAWFENETGGSPLASDIEILETVTIWAEENASQPRIAVRVVIDEGITGYDLIELNYQEFLISTSPTISDLQPQDNTIRWFDARSGGTELSPGLALEDGKKYYGQKVDGACRFEVGVFVGVYEPEGDGWQSFCASEDATVADLEERYTISDNHELVWYKEETGGATYSLDEGLVDNGVYYLTQKDVLGNESARKRIVVSIFDVPAPYVADRIQTFYTNEPVYVSDLVAIGSNIVWYDAAFEGTAYSPSEQLIDGVTYYAAQAETGCSPGDIGCCSSTQREEVIVRITDELPPSLVGCIRFRPQPGARYVISAWVREDGLQAINPMTRNFSEVSDVFVDLLNHILKDKVLASLPEERHIPEVYIPKADTREFDVLVPFLANTEDKNLTIYNFEYIKEKQDGNGADKTIGFSFALSPESNATRFEYRTPKVKLDFPSDYNSYDGDASYRYPLLGNPELKLSFKTANICGSKLCITSSFEISGQTVETVTEQAVDRLPFGQIVYFDIERRVDVNISYNNQNLSNDSNSASLLNDQITMYDYVSDPTYQVMDYANSLLKLRYRNSDGVDIPLETRKVEFRPKGAIIDGWQRVSADFTIPLEATNMVISLESNLQNDASALLNVYFDDIRMHPFDGNMKTFVYDPITQRLQSELDENNYATFYEYDQEGGLIRVKKETERGVFTIQETRSGNSKLNNAQE